jgi:methoxymalonate biosynthesis acyl carrier protein
MRKTVEILNSVRPECDFAASQNFLGDGLLDSYDMVMLVSEFEKEYSISIDGTDIVPENFHNLASIEALLSKYGVAG